MHRSPPSVFIISAIFLLIVGLAVGVFWLNTQAAERGIEKDAIIKATDWVEYVSHSFPDIKSVLDTNELTEEQQNFILRLKAAGNILGFSLFDGSGQLVLSDLDNRALSPQHDTTVREVLSSRKPIARLQHLSSVEQYPGLYAEAYLPLISATDNVLGVVEVYIDQSRTGAVFRQAVAGVSFYISILVTFAFLVPALAFYWRSEQAKASHSRLSYLSHHDLLTGTFNRDGFFSEYALRQNSVKAEGCFYAMVLMDISNFKYVNKEYGQQSGDAVLTVTTNRLLDFLDPKAIIARFSADKFFIAIPAMNNSDLEETILGVLKRVQVPYRINERSIAIFVNIGACICHDENIDVETKIQRAELALFNVKVSVGESYCIYREDLEKQIVHNRTIEHLLRTGLEQGRFEIYYQPILAARERKLAGFEALLRLRDDMGMMIPPLEFIPMAESLGLIDEIGSWVIKNAMIKAASWPEQIYISINISVVQFQTGRLLSQVREHLESSQVTPQRIEFEVTESVMIDQDYQVKEQIYELQSLGIRFSVDDFGTGFSSLSYLWMFQFNKLKIDRSFIHALSADIDKAIQILSTIILLAHRLKLYVTAEGIESEYHAEILEDLGCDQFQGYLFHPPLPAPDADALVLSSGLHIAPPSQP